MQEFGTLLRPLVVAGAVAAATPAIAQTDTGASHDGQSAGVLSFRRSLEYRGLGQVRRR